ncbi:MAG TPA: head GIN domain-containing protein [Puia sp.]|nr:head GIN domain-containing protein [Puia sp.]
MQKLALFLISFILINGIWAQKAIINDPNAVVRNVKGFHAIKVSNAIDLFLSQGDEEAVAVSSNDTKYRDRIRTEVENGVLKIWLDREGWSWDHGNKKLKAYVSCKTLDKLEASGASNILVNGVISGDRMELHLSGASDFKGSVKFNGLSIDQSGASDITINGSVGDLQIDASGASDTKGFDLITDNCSARVSGASDIKITVNKELNVHASGASSISYKGSAVIRDLKSSGASGISKKG